MWNSILPILCALAILAFRFAVGAVDPLYYTTTWTGTCQSGEYQSPIRLPVNSVEPMADSLVTTMNFPTVVSPVVKNSGHGLLVSWNGGIAEGSLLPTIQAGGDGIAANLLDPSLPSNVSVQVQPVQFHIHFPAEHVIGNTMYVGELHIVTLVAEGSAPASWGCDEFWAAPKNNTPNYKNCAAVFAVMFELGDTSPPYMETVVAGMPTLTEVDADFGQQTFDLNTMLPNDRSHYTYYGSLTTPPCHEGLRWHVFKQAVPVTLDMIYQAETKLATTHSPSEMHSILGYRVNNRFVQPVHNRTVWSWDASTAQGTIQQQAAKKTGSGRKLQ